ncbi:CARDB domain-containing protein [Metallosphaera yellowstonensis MK1]|uniref:CARDB domain-containing protein n=2 Tax=Metallosphaera TaxID=41980 RepID=H2C4J6_9CREN|nr:CARDB domain-containing protein [Metallosphaera yellowstonensis MK1]
MLWTILECIGKIYKMQSLSVAEIMRQTAGILILLTLLSPALLIVTHTSSNASQNMFNVTFQEQGLPSGTQWSVTLNGTTKTSTGSQITFQVNGPAYLQYSVAKAGNYIPTPSSGTLFINSSQLINVSFAPPFIKLIITGFSVISLSNGSAVPELQPGSNYELLVDVKNEGNVQTLIFVEETVTMAGKVYANVTPVESLGAGSQTQVGFEFTPPQSGVYTLDVLVKAGSNISVSQSFPLYVGVSPKLQLFNVTFQEQGLPSGTQWSVTLNGTTKTSTGSQITFQVKGGKYEYSVGQVTGFQAETPSGVIFVNGTTSVRVEFLPLVFLPTPSVKLYYANGSPILNFQVQVNSSFTIKVTVNNQGNYSGKGYLLVLVEPLNLTRQFNYTLPVNGSATFQVSITPPQAGSYTVTVSTYSVTPQGVQLEKESSITFTAVKPTQVSPPTKTNTTSTTTPSNTSKHTNQSSPPAPPTTGGGLNTTLIVGIVVVVVIVFAVVLILRRR